VLESEGFVVFEPFASMYPFETWIVPKDHAASFGRVPTDEVKHFAHVVNETLKRIHKGLAYPDYNYTLYTAPLDEQTADHYHWSLQIIPRLRSSSGFEMSSGMHVNPLLPEMAAKYLREI